MLLLKLIFQTFVLYQISQIISEAKITKPVREYLKQRVDKHWIIRVLHSLLSCFICTSVWVGFLLTPLLFDFAQYLGYNTISWFWNGLFFSSITWFMNVWEQNKLKE